MGRKKKKDLSRWGGVLTAQWLPVAAGNKGKGILSTNYYNSWDY